MEFKKIAAQKYKNKGRYKDKSKVVPKQTDKQNTYQSSEDESHLDSNWYRYQSRDDEEDHISKDFCVLSKTPISHQDFTFKSDKQLFQDVSLTIKDKKYFDLDLNLLEESIATIPFNLRVGIDDSYFNADQLQAFKDKAEKARNTYKAGMQQTKTIEGLNSGDKSSNETSKSINEIITASEQYTNVDKENCDKETKEASKDEDLEEWLDDFLAD